MLDRNASNALKGDIYFVLASVKQKGNALRHTSVEWRGNKEEATKMFVSAAVRQNGNALLLASKALKDDRL